MEMSGEHRIAAPRDTVWAALNDPEALKASIAGCEELEKTSDTEFTAKVRAKVGPVSARFSGKVTLSEIDPPNGYRIDGEGQGGAAGFAKGGASVALEEEGDTTLLKYEVNASVGGKLAQIGSRLIDGTARKMADDFFTRFAERLESEPEDGEKPEEAPTEDAAPAEPTPEATQAAEPAASTPAAEPAPEADSEETGKGGLSPLVWIGALVIALGIAIVALA